MNGVSLREAVYTQRAIRRFSDEPVSEGAVEEMLEAAIRAPSAGNTQPWYFVVVRDRETKERLGQFYLDSWLEIDEERRKEPAYRDGGDLGRNMGDVPVVIMACIERVEDLPGPRSGTYWASVYPAVQNLMLAARALGLGTVITTNHTRYEDEVKEYLEIPDDVDTAALIPVGYPAADDPFTETRRTPAEEVTFRDRWGRREG